jgi:hypothetical protein
MLTYADVCWSMLTYADADAAHTQANLREDALDRNPGPLTRVNPKPRYAGDELDFDVTEWHDEWKRDTLAGMPAPYVSIRQHMPAPYVSIRQQTSGSAILSRVRASGRRH